MPPFFVVFAGRHVPACCAAVALLMVEHAAGTHGYAELWGLVAGTHELIAYEGRKP